MRLIEKLVTFVIFNFGPLIGFYIINQFWGFKVSIIVSLILIVTQFSVAKLKKKKIGSYFYYTSGIIIFFGITDLFAERPFLFKFEASLTNLLTAGYFGLSLFEDKPIVQRFAEMQNRIDDQQTPDKLFFFRFFTILWCLYFVLKAALYLWINFNTSINDGIITRVIIGKVSFWVMLFISIGLPKQIWMILERLRLFPSQREEENSITTL